MRDENTSARLCVKNAGGAYAQGGGGIFVGHYGMYLLLINNELTLPFKSTTLHMLP